MTKLVKLRAILVQLQSWTFKNNLTMVKETMKKLIKLLSIVEHLQKRIFEIFFNHCEGDDNKIIRINAHCTASLKVNEVSKFPYTIYVLMCDTTKDFVID